MKALLDKLLSAELLTEESKAELETAIKEHMASVEANAKQEAIATVTAELHEQWIGERDTLIEALDARVTEMLNKELDELKEDISNFRDLEAEYAEKFVTHKATLAEQFQADMADLIEKLDEFVDIRIQEEMEELKTDLTEARKDQFGRAVFEAFATEYAQFHVNDDSIANTLKSTERQLQAVNEALEGAEKRAAAAERKIEMERVLSPLNGHHREVMEAILSRIDTPLLAESYRAYIGRVLKESAPSEKETKVLAEGSKSTEIIGTAVTGNDEERLNQTRKEVALQEAADVNTNTLSKEDRDRMRRLAGIA